MQEETSGGTTTINQYPNNNGWNGGWGWGAPYAAVPAVPAYSGYGNFGGGFLDGIMRGFGGNINVGGGRGTAGVTLGTVGTVLSGVLAIGALARGGLFGGHGGNPHEDFVTQRELSLVRENGTLAAENGQLKAQIYTDNKTDSVIKTLVEWRQRQELIDAQIAADVATLKQENANLKASLGSMLGTYINPQTFAPSQAVFAQVQAANSAKTATAAAA